MTAKLNYGETLSLSEEIVNLIPWDLPSNTLVCLKFGCLVTTAMQIGGIVRVIDLHSCMDVYPGTISMLANGLQCEPRLVSTYVKQGLVDADDFMNALRSWDWPETN